MASRNTRVTHRTHPRSSTIVASGNDRSGAAAVRAHQYDHVVESQEPRESFAHRVNEFLQPLVPKKLHGFMMLLYRQATYRTKVPLPWLFKLWFHGSISR